MAATVVSGSRAKVTAVTTIGAIDTYLRDKRTTGGINRRTEQQMRGTLYAFASHCPDDPTKITRRHVLRWLRTTGHLAANSRRLYFCTVRQFTSHLLRRGVLRKDPFDDMTTPKLTRAVHRTLADDQVRALLAACEVPRERMIVLLGVHVGLRRAELAALEVGDLSLAGRTVLVRRGKGGHQRLVPMSAEACTAAARYVASEALSEGPLLRSVRYPQEGIGPSTVGAIFRRIAYRSGVKVRAGDSVGAHSLRHTAATSWYESSGDVLAVRDLLGHESLATTQRYVRGMNVERLRAAVEGRSYLDAA